MSPSNGGQTHWKASNIQQYKTTGCSQGHAKNSRWRTACLAMEEMHTTYGSLRSCFLRRLKVLVWDGDEIQIDSVSEKMCPLKTPMKFKHCPAKSPIIQIEDRTCSRRGHHQGLDGCSWILRFTMVCSFRLFHTSWTSGPVNDWYRTCKITGHVVFNMGSSNLAAATILKRISIGMRSTPQFWTNITVVRSDHIYHPPRFCFTSSWICNAHSRPSMPGILTSRSTRRGFVMWPSGVMAWTSLPCWRLWAAEVFHGQVHDQVILKPVFFLELVQLGISTELNPIHIDPLLPSKSNFDDFNGFNIFQKKSKLQHLQLINWSIA